MFYTYILKSERDDKLYIGYTSDLKKRYSEHILGKVFSTKGRLPLKLIFYESFLDKNDALRRERYFKTSAGKRSLSLMLRSYFNQKSKI